MTATELGWITLGAGVLVVAIVTLLLVILIRTVDRIRAVLDDVWTTGQEIANNTANLDLLRRMNMVAVDTRATARTLADRRRRGVAGAPGEGAR